MYGCKNLDILNVNTVQNRFHNNIPLTVLLKKIQSSQDKEGCVGKALQYRDKLEQLGNIDYQLIGLYTDTLQGWQPHMGIRIKKNNQWFYVDPSDSKFPNGVPYSCIKNKKIIPVFDYPRNSTVSDIRKKRYSKAHIYGSLINPKTHPKSPRINYNACK